MEQNALDKIDMGELSRQLQKARIRRGLTQEDAAKILSVARTTITAIESGKRRVRPEELIKLAHAYNYQISDLIRPRPKLTISEPQFRGPVIQNEEDAEKVKPTLEELKQFIGNYYELEQLTGIFPVHKYPQEYDIEGIKTSEAAETVAIEERNRLGLGDSAVPILRKILEKDVGLRIFYMPIQPSKFSAIYLYDDQAGGCIAINSNHPEERRRWSLAHEYGHFLVHRKRPTVYAEDHYQRKPGSERFADEFAMFFLMPTNSLIRQVNDIKRKNDNKIRPTDLCELASYYGVSVTAITQRLEDMKLLPTGTWDYLKRMGFKVQEVQKQLGLAPTPSQDSKFPQRYTGLAIEAFRDGIITEGMLANILEISRLEAREIATVINIDSEEIAYDTINIEQERSTGTQGDR